MRITRQELHHQGVHGRIEACSQKKPKQYIQQHSVSITLASHRNDKKNESKSQNICVILLQMQHFHCFRLKDLKNSCLLNWSQFKITSPEVLWNSFMKVRAGSLDRFNFWLYANPAGLTGAFRFCTTSARHHRVGLWVNICPASSEEAIFSLLLMKTSLRSQQSHLVSAPHNSLVPSATQQLAVLWLFCSQL